MEYIRMQLDGIDQNTIEWDRIGLNRIEYSYMSKSWIRELILISLTTSERVIALFPTVANKPSLIELLTLVAHNKIISVTKNIFFNLITG